MDAEFAAALVAALADLEDIPKKRTAKVKMKSGGEYSYGYADLGDSLTYVRPILKEHGLAVFQSAHSDGDDVAVTTTILHASGGSFTSEPLRLHAGGTPQKVGSAITYARRYSLLAALGLATEDDDGQTAANAQPRQQSSQPRRQSKPAEEEPPKAVKSQKDDLKAIIMRLMRLPETDENRADAEDLWGDIAGSFGAIPNEFGKAVELLEGLAELGFYPTADQEPFGDPDVGEQS